MGAISDSNSTARDSPVSPYPILSVDPKPTLIDQPPAAAAGGAEVLMAFGIQNKFNVNLYFCWYVVNAGKSKKLFYVNFPPPTLSNNIITKWIEFRVVGPTM